MEEKIFYHSPIILPSGISYRKNPTNNSVIVDFVGYVNNDEINIVSSILLDENMIDNFIDNLLKIKNNNIKQQ
ncbi:hypothetical protein [Brachyspira pilosicoli]|uniref:hypothetical protein n=1 Tax=Brachyspira pilosicoli TaxID=52584 RepID=UPI0012F510D6|nr:hypothetical protein [Brachyspira pilosicoli]